MTSEDRLNAAEGPGDYYARLRRQGRSRLGAAWSTAGQSIAQIGHATGLTDETFAGQAKKRRDVQAMGFASEDAGGAHFRIQEELLKVSVAKAEENAKAMEREIELRKMLNASLEAWAARGVSPDRLVEFGMDNFRLPGVAFDADRIKKMMGK
jgi:hypothetical protein